MAEFDFIEYRLNFRKALNLPLSASNEMYPILYSDWLYKVFESGWQRLFGEDFPYSSIKISSGFPFYKEDSHILAYLPDKQDFVSVVRDAFSAGDLKFGLTSWRFYNRPRAQFNKLSGRREKRYSTIELHFKENAGIWFGARTSDKDVRSKLESVIKFVGEEGIGSGRSAGYGSFELAEINEISVYKEADSVAVSMSRFMTQDELSTENLFAEIRPMNVALRASAKDGKKLYPIFGEGTVLNFKENVNFTEFGKFIGDDAENDKPGEKRAAFLFALPVPAKMYKLQSN